jgi:hypothetical protein
LIQYILWKGEAVMREPGIEFTEDDLQYLVRVLMPSTEDRQRMARVLREDAEILEAMLADERVFQRMLADPLSVLRVSPALFFAILLARVRADLEHEPYTLERSKRLSMVLFDVPQIVELLDDRQLRAYLTELLVSFVRINSFSFNVRIRPGLWRRVRFSDFDIDSLVRYCNAIDESERFPAYKRIADICLFTLGIFSAPQPENPSAELPRMEGMRKTKRNQDDYVNEGVTFYRLAARHGDVRARGRSEVLSTLADKFTLAVKPLAVMSARYLRPFKDSVFLQQ